MRHGCYKDITGKRYGRLVVLGECKGLKWGNTRWECECDCGRKKVIRQSSLHGGTMSCGCLVREAVALHVKSRRTLPEAAYNLSRRNRECVYLSDTYIKSKLKRCGVVENFKDARWR